jgi:selenocysteine lyase/cysteine desulfurase
VVGLDFINMDNSLISHKLEKEFGLINRCGLHCSPAAHKSLGTYPHGAVRLSFSHFNTTEEVNYATGAILSLLSD